MEISVAVTVTINDEEIDCNATGSMVPYVPAKISGPPENCYPAEGGYCEDVCVKRKDTGEDITDKLNEIEMERVENALAEGAASLEENYNDYNDEGEY
jgi:hypothetical protein